MNRRLLYFLVLLCMALLLSGCALLTVNEMYDLPKRSEEYNHLQSAVETAMKNLEYAAPIAGENQQTLQMADLDGDGIDEYLLFARGKSEKPMQILIFKKAVDSYWLFANIESNGFAFEQVEYVPIDDQPGFEVVVGHQVSNQVSRSVSVYSFASGDPKQILSANYAKFLTCDLDQNGRSELILIQPAHSNADNAVAVRYWFEKGMLERSREADLSSTADSVKRIMVSRLYGNDPAVYVASAVNNGSIVTDILAIKDNAFHNVSFSNESGTSVSTLRNYYVYADDIDKDGILELPSLITMKPFDNRQSGEQQYLIRWFAMDIDGNEIDKRFTYHNFLGGWYLELDDPWASRVSVHQQNAGVYNFCVWDEKFETAIPVVQVFTLTGSDRDAAAQENNCFVLHRAEGVVYAARLDAAAVRFDITQEKIIDSFHLIHQDWKTGET